MGGGGAMRAAAKVAGIGVVNAGIRGGISGVSAPAEQSVRNASRPVSAILSKANGGDVPAAAVQRPAWELDDWEFAGGVEEEMVVDSTEPVARVVFGGAPPSFQEAKAATVELKDALQKVYLSPYAAGGGGGGSLGGNQQTDYFETKSCITCDPNGAALPQNAIKAFSLLNESPKIQTVVAALASDPKVWNAVWENEALQELLESQSQSAQSSEVNESVTDANFQDAESTKFIQSSDAENEAGNPKTEPLDFFDNIKLTVVEMVTNVSSYLKKIFGFSSAENSSEATDENAGSATIEKSLGASLMALAVMVIMVVVLNRA